MSSQRTDGRGREADTPMSVPAKGWKDIALRVKDEVKQDNLPLMAAGVAFYAVLALFPAITALVSVYGLIADPGQVEQQLAQLPLPAEAASLIQGQVQAVAAGADGALTFGFAASLLAVLWSVSSGMQNLMKGVNAAYDEQDERGFLKRRGVALALTLLALVLAVVAIGGIAVVPAVVAAMGIEGALRTVLLLVRWPLLAVIVAVGLAIIYRYSPDRDNPRWAWVTHGAVIAVLLWLAASIGFSFYLRNFGNYNETYGALGGAIILLLWLFLTSFVVLLGAEINAESERQTRHDTTEGQARPMGRRQAFAADNLGKTAD